VNTVSPPPKAGRREWIGLGVIALPCLLYSMDLTVLNLAVPSLSADLKPSSTQLRHVRSASQPAEPDRGPERAIADTASTRSDIRGSTPRAMLFGPGPS